MIFKSKSYFYYVDSVKNDEAERMTLLGLFQESNNLGPF